MEHQGPTLKDSNGFAIATRSLLLEVTANGDATLDFTGLDDTFPRYVIEGDNVGASVVAVELNVIFSVSGSFKSGDDDYVWTVTKVDSNAGESSSRDSSDSRISTCRNVSGDKWGSGGSQTGDITFTITRGGTSNYPRISSVTDNLNDNAHLMHTTGIGAYKGTTSDPSGALIAGGIDGVRLSFSSGLIQQGNFRLYGVE